MCTFSQSVETRSMFKHTAPHYACCLLNTPIRVGVADAMHTQYSVSVLLN